MDADAGDVNPDVKVKAGPASLDQPRTAYTLAEWRAEATRLFGPDPMGWRFVCPACGHVASVQDWKDAGASNGAAAFSCVGRWTLGDDAPDMGTKPGPCNYAGGGLFRLNPIMVTAPDGETQEAFDFAATAPKEAPHE